MKKILLLCALCISIDAIGQGLSPDRVAKIKACTVKITFEGNTAQSGSAFFIRGDGLMLTCWHVIEPALTRDPKTNAITGFKKITVITSGGKKLEAGILLDVINKDYINAISYDYCLMALVDTKHPPLPFLNLGNYNNLNEGDEVYTCGYNPVTEQQMVTKGMVASKFTDTTITIMEGGKLTQKPRQQALLDMTINRSGGAVMKLGATANDDVIVGIVDFAVLPNGLGTENTAASAIGGCVSINHFLEGITKLK